jgi:hypothetical protein
MTDNEIDKNISERENIRRLWTKE